MKKNKTNFRSNYSLTLYIMIIILIAIIVGSLILVVVSAINENLLFGKGSIITYLIIGLGIMLAISIVISYFASKMLNKYIKLVQMALRNVKQGNFDIKYKESKNKYINEIIIDFNDMVEKLNSVPMLRNDFVSNFSHEFKTPIASIKGFAEVLKSKPNLKIEEKNEYLQIIIDECTRLTNLANNTLLISKLDTQKILNKSDKIFIDEQIDQCLFMLEKRIKEKNIHIKFNATPALFICDSTLLQQVWINILDNAIKFTKDKINIEIKNEKEKIFVIIEDNGIGINDESISHIFEKFYQADPSHSNDGSGLGLATANKIIALHNGTINVESKLLKGTRFTISLPTTQIS